MISTNLALPVFYFYVYRSWPVFAKKVSLWRLLYPKRIYRRLWWSFPRPTGRLLATLKGRFGTSKSPNFSKEKHLPNLHFGVQHVDLNLYLIWRFNVNWGFMLIFWKLIILGCNMLIFHKCIYKIWKHHVIFLVIELLNPDENTKVTSDGMELFVLVA